MRHRLGKGHSVALVKGRQDEEIRCPVGLADPVRRPFADKSNAPAEPRRRDHTPDRSRGRGITLQRADANQAPVEIANPPQGLDEHAMSFARDQACDAEQRAGRAPRSPPTSLRLCRARRDHGDPVGRDAIGCHSGGGSPAGTENAAKPRQHGSFESGQLLRLILRKPGFLCKWMVDQGDQPQTARLRRDRPLQPGQSQAVDNRCGPRREAPQRCRRRSPERAR